MTIAEIYKALHDCALTLYDTGEASAVAFFILEERFGVDRAGYALRRGDTISAKGLDTVLEELAAGRPAQYIAGHAWFCGMRFEVGEGVLIPRPETEELVRWIVSETGPGAKVLDIGTGSGAIAVALARELEGAVVTASDISPVAIDIAGRNAIASDARVEMVLNDILDSAQGVELERKGPFDVIVSNPPYIPESGAAGMHINVRDHEPRGALFVPDGEPLLFYRVISAFAARNLTEEGTVYFEVHNDFAEGVADLLTWQGFTGVEIRRDIHGRERMVRGIKPGGDA